MDKNDFALSVALMAVAVAVGLTALARPITAAAAAVPNNLGSLADWALVFLGAAAIVGSLFVGFQSVGFQRRRDEALADAFCLRMMPAAAIVLGEIRRVRKFADDFDYGLLFHLPLTATMGLSAAEVERLETEHIAARLTIAIGVPDRPVEQMVAFPHDVLAAVEQLDQFLAMHHRKLGSYVPHLPSFAAKPEAREIYKSEIRDSLNNLELLANEIQAYVGPRNDAIVKTGKLGRRHIAGS